MQEGTTWRVMAADRPCGEFYDFYSVGLEYFGYTLAVAASDVHNQLRALACEYWGSRILPSVTEMESVWKNTQKILLFCMYGGPHAPWSRAGASFVLLSSEYCLGVVCFFCMTN
jgi:hypothetical protein